MASANKQASDLVAKLKAKSATSRDEVIDELIQLGAAAVPPLIKALRHKDYKVRMAAAQALGRIRNREAISALIETLSDSSKNAQEAAADALTKIGPPAVSALLDALIGKDQSARKWAAEALGSIGDESVAHELVARLSDANIEVQRAVVTALGALKSKKAFSRSSGTGLGQRGAGTSGRRALGKIRGSVAVSPHRYSPITQR